MSETQVIDVPTVQADRLARHLEWQRLMQAAVASALDENRGQGHTVVIMSDDKVVSRKPGDC